jgi:hypothetical protein
MSESIKRESSRSEAGRLGEMCLEKSDVGGEDGEEGRS